MTTQTLKLGELCRTCLSKENMLLCIFNEELECMPLDHVISAVTGIKIEKNDSFPKYVCHDCKDKAQMAYKFKKKSQEAEVELRKLMEKDMLVHTEVKIKEDPDNDFSVLADDTALDYDSMSCNEIDLNIVAGNTFQCNLCNEVFDSKDTFSDHVNNVCLKVEFDQPMCCCPICNLTFDNSNSLTKHMWKAHKDLAQPKKRGRPKTVHHRNILDKLANNGFLIKKLHLTPAHVCCFCKDRFETKEELIDHYYNGHLDTKVYTCADCKKNYLQLASFEGHLCESPTESLSQANIDVDTEQQSAPIMFSVTDLHSVLDPEYYCENVEDPGICSFCDEIILTKANMMSHIDKYHPDESQRCSFCLKVFASVKSAKRHKLSCKQIERKYRCRLCGLRYSYEISLNKHILRYHQGESVSTRFIDRKASDEKKHPCTMCDRSFPREDTLERHIQNHLKIYECDTCHKKFNRKDNLKSHMRVHMPRPPAPAARSLCTFCGRSFSNTSNMIVHLRRHTGEKPYKCDFCDKGFPRSTDLACHRRSHTGEKVCHCSVCGKSFSRSGRLARHMRVHTGQKPYKCTYCDKAFSQSNDLNIHVRRHTGDKPYVCDVCGDRFIQGTALQSHRRSHGHYAPPPAAPALRQPEGAPILSAPSHT